MSKRLVLIQSISGSPCQECKDRHPSCHSKCDRYSKFREKCDKVAKEKEKDRLATPQPSRKMLQFMKNKSMGR